MLQPQQINDILTKSKQSGLSREEAKVMLQKAEQRTTQAPQPQKPTLMQNIDTNTKEILKGYADVPGYVYNKLTEKKPSGFINAGINLAKSIIPGASALFSSTAKDMAKSGIQEYNELAGRPLEGGDVMGRIGQRAYEKPVTTALDLAPGVGFLKRLGGAKNVGRAGTSSGFRQSMAQKADDIATRGIGNPARQAKLQQQTGRTVGSFIDEYGLYDRDPATATQVKRDIGARFDESAMQSGKNLSIRELVGSIDQEIASIKGGRKAISDANAQKIAELNRRRQMIIDEFGESGNIGLDEATSFRRDVIDPDVPKSQFGLNPSDAGKGAGVKAVRDIFRKKSIEVAPELEKLGMDYRMAIEIEKIITAHAARVGNRQLLNFSKLGSAGVGAFLSGIPGAMGGFLVERFVNSPKFIEILSKSFRKLSETPAPKKPIPQSVKNTVLFGQGARLLDKEPQPDQRIESTNQPQSYNP